VGLFWANPADLTWKGFLLAFSRDSVLAQTFIDTPVFDASFGTAGGGAGEVNGATYWEAAGVGFGVNNTFTIDAATYGAQSTVGSGIWTGGTTRSGTISGRAKKIQLDRLQGTGLPASFDIDFTFTGLQSVGLICIMPTPCTSTPLLELHRAARAGRLDPTATTRFMLGLPPGAPVPARRSPPAAGR
jgi:hypothetical protein